MTITVDHARAQLHRLLSSEQEEVVMQGCALIGALVHDPDLRVVVEELAEGCEVRESGDLRVGEALEALFPVDEEPLDPDQIAGLTPVSERENKWNRPPRVALHLLRALDRLETTEHLRIDITGVSDAIHLVSGLENLRVLELTNQRGAERLDAPTGLRSLERFVIPRGGTLKRVDLSGLLDVSEIEISRSRHITHLTGLSHLGRLRMLSVSRGRRLQHIDTLEGLEQLETLYLTGCAALTSLDDVLGSGALGRLHTLFLDGAAALWDIDALRTLTSLEALSLTGCSSLTSIEPLEGLQRLKTLSLWGCSRLENVDSLAGMKDLTTLDLSSCGSLQNLDGLRGLVNLEELNVLSCDALSDVRGLADLPNLTRLDLRAGRNVPKPLRGWHRGRDAVATLQKRLKAMG